MHALPFPYRATIFAKDRTTAAAEGVPVAVWPASAATRRSAAGSGVAATHEGEGRLADYALWDRNGIQVEIDGIRYTIVGAERQVFLPHTSITFTRLRGGG